MTEQVKKLMSILDLTEQEALELIEDDKKVDRMKDSEVNADLNPEQQKAAKKARQADRKPTVFKFDKPKRKENDSKRFIIELLKNALEPNSDSPVEVTNPEREMIFYYSGVKYKLTLSAPRK